MNTNENHLNVIAKQWNSVEGLDNQYAHIEIVVAFLVVKIFGFLVIARNPRNEFRRK